MDCVKQCPPSACARIPKPIHSIDLLLRVMLLRMRTELHRTSCTQHARFHAAVRREREQECAQEEIRVCVRKTGGQMDSVCVFVFVFVFDDEL